MVTEIWKQINPNGIQIQIFLTIKKKMWGKTEKQGNLVYLRRVEACLYLRCLFKGKRRMSPYFFHGLLPMILCSVAEYPTASHNLSARLCSKVLSTHVFSTISFPWSPLHTRMFNNLKCHREVGLAFSLLRLPTDFMTPSLPRRMWSRKIKRRLSFW